MDTNCGEFHDLALAHKRVSFVMHGVTLIASLVVVLPGITR